MSLRLYLFLGIALLGVISLLPLRSKLINPAEEVGHVVSRIQVAEETFSIELESPPYELEHYYQSMTGPASNQPGIRCLPGADDEEIVWITGVASRVVAANTRETISPEFFCHANLTLSPDSTSPEQHNQSFEPPRNLDWRLFTLIPGKMDIHLPDGFGIPIRNATELDFYTMSINQNPGKTAKVRFRSSIHFTRDSRNYSSPKPLYRRAVYVYQQHRESVSEDAALTTNKVDRHQGEECALNCERDQRGASPSLQIEQPDYSLDLELLPESSEKPSHPGATCCVVNASASGVMQQFGGENTIHWMVPPGKHSYRSEVTEQLELPEDTTAHYITGHLHPCGTALKLVDMESGDVVFEIRSRDFEDRIGVAEMSEVSSTEGIEIQKDRRYELIADYDNRRDVPIDAMGIMYLYLAE